MKSTIILNIIKGIFTLAPKIIEKGGLKLTEKGRLVITLIFGFVYILFTSIGIYVLFDDDKNNDKMSEDFLNRADDIGEILTNE